MQILNKKELEKQKKPILDKIRKGDVFIYPTDTIYGIGCNARSKKAVSKVREIKKRDKKPMSVVAPTKKWIRENCETKNREKWIKKLPAAHTLILNLKDKRAVAKNVNQGLDTLGVRIPDHWFNSYVKVPIVTTSVNITGKQHMTSIEDLTEEIKSRVDFIVYEGPHMSRPSKIIDLTKEKPRIIQR